MMNKKLLFIMNPVSGKRGSKSGFIYALNEFSKHGYQVEVYITQARRDAYTYALNHGSNYDIVAVSGGDGTLNEVTSALVQLEKKPLLGYIPTGTMNDFGTNFNLTNDFKKGAQIICAEKTDVFDMGHINDQYFNYVAGFGMICEVSYETDQNLKSQFGNLAYVIKAISMLPNLRPYHVKINMDGILVEKDIMFGLIINGVRVSGFDLVKKSDDAIRDGVFDIILVEHTENLLELYNYATGLLNPEAEVKYVYRYQAKSITIESNEEIKWTLDGEEGKPTTLASIENLQQALTIICNK